MHRYIAAAAVFIAWLAAPGVASADSGAITNATDGGGGWVLVTYTVTGTCADQPVGACSWWTYAVQGPAGTPASHGSRTAAR